MKESLEQLEGLKLLLQLSNLTADQEAKVQELTEEYIMQLQEVLISDL